MQPNLNLANLIYPQIWQHIKSKFPKLDMDTIDIDCHNPNTITMQIPDYDTITIGQFQDALIYCLATHDIDLIQCTSNFDLNHTYTITITEIAP